MGKARGMSCFGQSQGNELFWANQMLGESLLNRLVQVKKVKNFAFIHYNDRSSALAAIDAMHEEQVASLDMLISLP